MDLVGSINNALSAVSPKITADMLYSSIRNPYRHKWCITMEPNDNPSSVAPKNPFTKLGFPRNLIPATAFQLDTYKINNESINITEGYDIDLPVSYVFSRSLTITIYNEFTDGGKPVNLMRSWLREYRNAVFSSYKTTVPYKKACTKFRIYIYSPQFKLIDTYEYYGIPDLSDPSISQDSDTNFNLNVILLGESDNNPNLPGKS